MTKLYFKPNILKLKTITYSSEDKITCNFYMLVRQYLLPFPRTEKVPFLWKRFLNITMHERTSQSM